MRWMGRFLAYSIWLALACGDSHTMKGDEYSGARAHDSTAADDASAVLCGHFRCQPEFRCEYDTCVPDAPQPPSGPSQLHDPLSSGRYVFALETENQRLIRIDSALLEVQSFSGGLAPIDLAVVGSRELSFLLDAHNTLELLDHRVDPPHSAVWSTARAMSHLVVAPQGEYVVAYFDWDDPRAQQRQRYLASDVSAPRSSKPKPNGCTMTSLAQSAKSGPSAPYSPGLQCASPWEAKPTARVHHAFPSQRYAWEPPSSGDAAGFGTLFGHMEG